MARAFNYERAAEALVDAIYDTDANVAQKYDVTERTIQNWRARLNEDAMLSQFFQIKRQSKEDEWRGDIGQALKSCIDFITRAPQHLNLSDPNCLHAVAGAAKILAEVSLTMKVLDERLIGQHRQENAPAGTMATGAQPAAYA